MYEIGQYYTFIFQERIIGKDENIYLGVTDPNNPDVVISIKPFEFQREWDIANTIECFCFKQNVYGQFYFQQSREAILNSLYIPKLNHYSEFVIEKRIENENQSVCCVISDAYGISQLYYPTDRYFWEQHQVGDSLVLYVVGVHASDKGKNY